MTAVFNEANAEVADGNCLGQSLERGYQAETLIAISSVPGTDAVPLPPSLERVGGLGPSNNSAQASLVMEIVEHVSSTAGGPEGWPVPETSLQRKFEKLAGQWRAETGGVSLTGRKVMHSAYQQIIGLGPGVVPIILGELQKKPDLWFWALRALTGENPVREEEAGKVDSMTEAWLNWGKAKGYLPQ